MNNNIEDYRLEHIFGNNKRCIFCGFTGTPTNVDWCLTITEAAKKIDELYSIIDYQFKQVQELTERINKQREEFTKKLNDAYGA